MKKLILALSIVIYSQLFFENMDAATPQSKYSIDSLCDACFKNNTDLALEILNYAIAHPGAIDINQECRYGITPFMSACHRKNLVIIQKILDNHAALKLDINNIKCKNRNNTDSIFMRICKDYPEIALKILRLHNALRLDVNIIIENNLIDNRSALHYAFSYKHWDLLLEMINMHNAKVIVFQELDDLGLLLQFFERIRDDYIYAAKRKTSLTDPKVHEALLYTLLHNKKYSDFYKLVNIAENALRDKNTLEHTCIIDQNEIMRIDLYSAHEEWITKNNVQPLTDFFVYLPTRMLLNMKIIETSEPYASYEDCFSRSMCTLYEKWFGRDEHSQTLNQVLWYGKEISPESLQNIHLFLFNRMLQKQIELKEHNKEQALCIGLQLTALSNTYFNAKTCLTALLGTLVSVEKNEQKKNILCARSRMFTNAFFASCVTKESQLYTDDESFNDSGNIFTKTAIDFYKNKFLSWECRDLRECYGRIRAGCLNHPMTYCHKNDCALGLYSNIVDLNPVRINNFNLSLLLCNNEKEILNWIQARRLIKTSDGYSTYSMPETHIEFFTNVFRYMTNNPKYLETWNKRI